MILKSNTLVNQTIGCLQNMMNELKFIYKLSNGKYSVKMVQDERSEDEVKELNTLTLHLGAFVLQNSRSKVNNFFHFSIGFETNYLFYEGTDSL